MTFGGSTGKKGPENKQKVEGHEAPTENIKQQGAKTGPDAVSEEKKTYQHDKRQATIELKKLIDTNRESIKEVLDTTDTHLVALRNSILADSGLSLSCGSEDLKKEIDGNFLTIGKNIEQYGSLTEKEKKEKDSDIDTYHTKLTKLAALGIGRTKENMSQDENKEEKLSWRDEKMAYFGLSKYWKKIGKVGNSLSYLFSNLGSVVDGAKQGYTQHKDKGMFSGIMGGLTGARQSIKQLRSATTNGDNIDRQDEAITIDDNGKEINVVAKDYVTEKVTNAIKNIEATGTENKEERKIRNLTLKNGHVESFGQSQEIEYDKDKKIFRIVGLNIEYAATDKGVEECVLTANLTNKCKHDYKESFTEKAKKYVKEKSTNLITFPLKMGTITKEDDKYFTFDDDELERPRWQVYGISRDTTVLSREALKKFPTMMSDKKHKDAYISFLNTEIGNTVLLEKE